MKKLLSIAIALVMVLTLSVSAMAADVDFVSSITNKGAPEIITTTDDSGRKVIGFVCDANGKKLTTEYEDCVVITSISDAQDSTEIPAEAKDTLIAVYEELNKADAKLSELCPELNDIVAKELGEGKTADDLVIKDLFDISAVCEELQTHLPVEGTYIDLSFDLSIPGDTLVVAMVYVDGKWEPVISTTNNGDGTITCRFDNIGPVAFLVPADADTDAESGSDTDTNTKPEVPVTGDTSQSQLILWIAVMGTSLTAVVVLAVVFLKKKKQ